MADKTKVKTYGADATLKQLSDSCQTDEDAYQGHLAGLERVDAEDGTKGTQCTYTRTPFSEIYVSKALFFVDLAAPTAQPPNTDVVFASADVYLNDAEAQVAVYREK
ncbi:MAG TPA: hypothetical protein VGO73_02985 [Pyrinomonadaceae bacterium]|nr:hypothetical protein [Pyrinomonadaceae bacterium]